MTVPPLYERVVTRLDGGFSYSTPSCASVATQQWRSRYGSHRAGPKVL